MGPLPLNPTGAPRWGTLDPNHTSWRRCWKDILRTLFYGSSYPIKISANAYPIFSIRQQYRFSSNKLVGERYYCNHSSRVAHSRGAQSRAGHQAVVYGTSDRRILVDLFGR